ncbi:MAG TPA: tRNA glutamyl-Q(34) synthetase GluQRS [Steroidobacteraceae bacterium]|nr:tRNA glutamyl-Q(34) synthetase GluQRS [Steroidobacteraceae bacterium]
MTARYCGRFAPSPTGPLHFGSLVAATASFLDARHAGGDWLLRIEDLDPPREVPGSADEIVATLATLGFQWTGSIVRQSERHAAYQAALDRLLAANLAFPCSCSRTELLAAQPPGRDPSDELYYQGWCRNGVRAPDRPTAMRFRVAPGTIAFEDRLQGRQTVDVALDTGDFVIRRRDSLFAYQLAVVVDDAAQNVTHVVRGADLLGSTARQIALQAALGLTTPEYAHLPVAIDANGIKLSKSTGAAAVDVRQPARELWRTLQFLKQGPPSDLRRGPLGTLWEWAIEHWQAQPLAGLRQMELV